MLAQTLHQYQDGSAFIGATVDGDSVVIGQTRSVENAAEGRYNDLLAAMPLVEAVELAKRILALQEAAEDAEIDRMAEEWEERLDAERFNWECSIEADYDFIRTGC